MSGCAEPGTHGSLFHSGDVMVRKAIRRALGAGLTSRPRRRRGPRRPSPAFAADPDPGVDKVVALLGGGGGSPNLATWTKGLSTLGSFGKPLPFVAASPGGLAGLDDLVEKGVASTLAGALTWADARHDRRGRAPPRRPQRPPRHHRRRPGRGEARPRQPRRDAHRHPAGARGGLREPQGRAVVAAGLRPRWRRPCRSGWCGPDRRPTGSTSRATTRTRRGSTSMSPRSCPPRPRPPWASSASP